MSAPFAHGSTKVGNDVTAVEGGDIYPQVNKHVEDYDRDNGYELPFVGSVTYIRHISIPRLIRQNFN